MRNEKKDERKLYKSKRNGISHTKKKKEASIRLFLLQNEMNRGDMKNKLQIYNI